MKLFVLIKKILADFHLVKEKDCKSRLRQVVEIINLMLRCQFTPDEYYTYRFFEKNKSYRDMLEYMSNYMAVSYFHPNLRDPVWAFLLGDKLSFNAFYGYYGFPVTNLLGYYHEDSSFESDSFNLKNPRDLENMLLIKKPETLVIKPAGGSMGRNVNVYRKVEYIGSDINFYKVDGSRETISQVVEFARKASGSKYTPGVILEEKLEQHELLSEINRTSINTVRIVTLLDKKDHAGVYLSILRVGRFGSGVDNASQGGIIVGLNRLSGELGQGSFYSKFNTGLLKKHPDSGIRFKGLKVPYWREIKDLCIQAAELTPFCRTVGWDVAVTPQGPVLVEGNSFWAMDFQAQSGGFLQPEVRKILADYNLKFPEGSLPEINGKELLKAFKLWFKKT